MNEYLAIAIGATALVIYTAVTLVLYVVGNLRNKKRMARAGLVMMIIFGGIGLTMIVVGITLMWVAALA
jgi:hypothetical protein